MNKILYEIDNNILQKKLENIKKELDNMNKTTDTMNIEIKTVNNIYNKILLKKEPVGSSKNAINYLKLQR